MDFFNTPEPVQPVAAPSTNQSISDDIISKILELDPIAQNDIIGTIVANIKTKRAQQIKDSEDRLKYLSDSFGQLNNLLSNAKV